MIIPNSLSPAPPLLQSRGRAVTRGAWSLDAGTHGTAISDTGGGYAVVVGVTSLGSVINKFLPDKVAKVLVFPLIWAISVEARREIFGIRWLQNFWLFCCMSLVHLNLAFYYITFQF